MWCVCARARARAHDGILFSHKKDGNTDLTHATILMNLERIILNFKEPTTKHSST